MRLHVESSTLRASCAMPAGWAGSNGSASPTIADVRGKRRSRRAARVVHRARPWREELGSRTHGHESLHRARVTAHRASEQASGSAELVRIPEEAVCVYVCEREGERARRAHTGMSASRFVAYLVRMSRCRHADDVVLVASVACGPCHDATGMCPRMIENAIAS